VKSDDGDFPDGQSPHSPLPASALYFPAVQDAHAESTKVFPAGQIHSVRAVLATFSPVQDEHTPLPAAVLIAEAPQGVQAPLSRVCPAGQTQVPDVDSTTKPEGHTHAVRAVLDTCPPAQVTHMSLMIAVPAAHSHTVRPELGTFPFVQAEQIPSFKIFVEGQVQVPESSENPLTHSHAV